MADRCTGRAAIALLAALLSSMAPGAPAAEGAAPPVPSTPAASRGELLYGLHCIECHNAQIHWREGRLARNWATLEAEVDRWQRAANLGWSRDDVREVTRYLGDTVYGFSAEQPTAASSVGSSTD